MEEIWKYWYSLGTIFLWASFVSCFCGILLPVILERKYQAKWFKIISYVICGLYATSFISFYFYTEHINPSIHYEIGLKFYRGDSFSTDIATAIQAFEKSANKNNVEACHMLGKIYISQKDIYIAIQWLKKGINLGDAKSAKILAELYDNNTFDTLSKQEKSESAYLAYSQALCLGDISVRQRMNALRTQLSQFIQKEAKSECENLNRRLGR